jgi:hypothetical protein
MKSVFGTSATLLIVVLLGGAPPAGLHAQRGITGGPYKQEEE